MAQGSDDFCAISGFSQVWVGRSPTIPTSQDLHGVGAVLNTVENLEVLLNHEPPYSRALSDFRVPLWKEAQALAFGYDRFPKFLSSSGVLSGDGSNKAFKVLKKRGLEDYFIVHSLNR